MCEEMIEESDRLARVTSRLVDFARPITPRPARLGLGELADRVAALCEPGLEARGLRLRARGDRSITWWADPDLLCQVLLGLVENAAEASPAGSLITLGWSPLAENRGKGLLLWVSDPGEGVPAELRERIFEPFFTTKESSKGTGLGLSISYDIIRRHGGDMTVSSEVGKGTTFTVCLPI